MLWVFRSLCREMKLSLRATAIAVAVAALHPTFFILSASVNNDPLMLLFFLVAILYTIRWYRRPAMKNILMIALAIGLAMMTKLSRHAALSTAPVFLSCSSAGAPIGRRARSSQFAASPALRAAGPVLPRAQPAACSISPGLYHEVSSALYIGDGRSSALAVFPLDQAVQSALLPPL